MVARKFKPSLAKSLSRNRMLPYLAHFISFTSNQEDSIWKEMAELFVNQIFSYKSFSKVIELDTMD